MNANFEFRVCNLSEIKARFLCTHDARRVFFFFFFSQCPCTDAEWRRESSLSFLLTSNYTRKRITWTKPIGVGAWATAEIFLVSVLHLVSRCRYERGDHVISQLARITLLFFHPLISGASLNDMFAKRKCIKIVINFFFFFRIHE